MLRLRTLALAVLLAGCGGEEAKAPTPAPALETPATPRDEAEERRQRLLRRLDAQRLYNIDWGPGRAQEVDAAGAVNYLRAATGFNLLFTVEARERAAARPVRLSAHNVTTREVLDQLVEHLRMRWEVRSSAIILRLDQESLPEAPKTPDPAAPDTPEIRRIRDLLGFRRVDLQFDMTILPGALDYLAWQTGLRYEIAEDLREDAIASEVTLFATDVTIAEALDLLLLEAFPGEACGYDVTALGVRLVRR